MRWLAMLLPMSLTSCSAADLIRARLGPTRGRLAAPRIGAPSAALAISRNEHNHVVLECRSPQNCQHSRIVAALALPNDRVYAETPDSLISRLRGTQIEPATFGNHTENVEATNPCGYAPDDWVELSEPDSPATGDASENAAPESSLQVLLRLASGARFFRSADGRLFAQVPVGSRHEIYGLKSAAFRDWLIGAYFADRARFRPQDVSRRRV